MRMIRMPCIAPQDLIRLCGTHARYVKANRDKAMEHYTHIPIRAMTAETSSHSVV